MPFSLQKNKVIVAKCFIFLCLSYPAAQLFYTYSQNTIGTNPHKTIMGVTGEWGFICLLLSLLVSSLRRWLCLFLRALKVKFGRRLADWNWIIRCRRMIGLFCFFYASLHLAAYLWLDIGLDWEELYYDVKDRPFILVGISGWLILTLLALTSPNICMRKMGRYWRTLHRFVYLAAVLACLHFYWLAKLGDNRPVIFTLLLAILLLDRILFSTIFSNTLKDDGMEAKR